MENAEELKIEDISVDSNTLNTLNLKEQMQKLAKGISNEKRIETAGLLDELEGKAVAKIPETPTTPTKSEGEER